jgi:mono/diheme cytochrome c family protein
MGKRYIVIMLLLSIAICCCKTQMKVAYNIPQQYSEKNKQILLADLEKGKKLYKIHCAECHGIFTKGKGDIPNFTKQQIEQYNARFLLRSPQNHAVMMQMSGDQVGSIINFLKFLKREEG